MKKTLAAVVVAMFALTSAAFAAEGMNTTEAPAAKTTVKKHKKAKKAKKAKKEKKAEEAAPAATPAAEAPAAGGAAHQ